MPNPATPTPPASPATPASIDRAGASEGPGIVMSCIILPAVGLLLVVLLCSCIGELGFRLPWTAPVLWKLRMLRLVSACTVGAALAVAGAALQCLLRNPLASPYVLGVSSGAGVGVLAGMALFPAAAGWLGVPLMAAFGACITAVLVYLVARGRGGLDVYSLLLTGIIFNSLNGAIMLVIYLYASRYVVADYISWSMGSISDTNSAALTAAALVAAIGGWVVMALHGHAFNVLSLGEDIALSSGINVKALRGWTFALTSLLTAAAVALAGPVGFVGLIAPHLCRLIFGNDHRRLLTLSGFMGAGLLAVADTFCRSTVMLFHVELPVGVVTALCGGPTFLWLLKRSGHGRGVS